MSYCCIAGTLDWLHQGDIIYDTYCSAEQCNNTIDMVITFDCLVIIAMLCFLYLALLALLVDYPLGDLSLQYLHIVRRDRISIIL